MNHSFSKCTLKARLWFAVIALCTVAFAQPNNEHIVFDQTVTQHSQADFIGVSLEDNIVCCFNGYSKE